MKRKPHIVFICPTYDYPSPRNLRIKGVFPTLKNRYRLSVIALSSKIKTIHVEKSGSDTVVRVPYRWISKYVANKRYGDTNLPGVALVVSKICSYMLKRFCLFPDPWVIEQRSLVNAISVIDDPDLLVASMMPFSMADVAYAYRRNCKSSRRIPVVLDIGDPLAANVVSPSYWSYEKKRSYEERVLSHADHVLVTNQATSDHYGKEFNVRQDSITVVPQGAKIPVEPRTRRTGAVAPNLLIDLRYAGLFIEDVRDPRLFFSELKNWQSRVKLTVCGGIDDCFTVGNQHIDFIGWKPESEIEVYLQIADCLFYMDNKMGMQTSGKIYELLVLRKPILFLYDNPHSSVLKECSEYGHVRFVRNNSEEINNCLNTMSEWFSDALLWLNGGDADYDVEKYSWENRAERMSSVFDSLLDRKLK